MLCLWIRVSREQFWKSELCSELEGLLWGRRRRCRRGEASAWVGLGTGQVLARLGCFPVASVRAGCIEVGRDGSSSFLHRNKHCADVCKLRVRCRGCWF